MKVSGLKLANTGGQVRFSTIYVEPSGPRWTVDENLGTFGTDSDVVIPLTYSDPDNSVLGISMTGELPLGIQFSAAEKEISGVVTDTETTRYDLVLTLHTTNGNITKSVYFTAHIPEFGVLFLTDPNLGEFSGGQGIDVGIKATVAPL